MFVMFCFWTLPNWECHTCWQSLIMNPFCKTTQDYLFGFSLWINWYESCVNLKGESKVMKVLLKLCFCRQYRGELLWRAQRATETQSTHDTHTKHESTANKSVAFTYTDTTAFTQCRAYFFFPPNVIFSVFFFCASLNKRHLYVSKWSDKCVYESMSMSFSVNMCDN